MSLPVDPTSQDKVARFDVCCLIGRLGQARVLREHQVWEAVRLLDIDLDLADRGRRNRFRALMTAEALVDAVLLLACLIEPPCRLRNIRRSDDAWVCTFVPQKGCAVRRFKGMHEDLAAAVLLALLQSSRPERMKSPAAMPLATKTS